MLWNATAIKGYSISGSDGSLGSVSDILFEDTLWTARWLVVDTGHWLAGRRVLLPISALGRPSASLRMFSVNLTMRQVKESPDIDTERPVSRQIESDLYRSYRVDPYWVGELYPVSNVIAMPALAPPLPSAGDREIMAIEDARRDHDDPHLRSANAVIGCHILATDGEIGHVEDFVVEDANWAIRYLKVDTKNWWPGKRVLIQPRMVDEIEWGERLVHLNVSRQKVKGSPPYDVSTSVDGAYTDRFQSCYGLF